MGTFALKKDEILSLFAACKTPDDRYKKIIDIGRNAPPFPPSAKVTANLVPGCQSILYLQSTLIDGLVYFEADSDALISKGLAHLLIHLYNGLPPETILIHPPLILTDLGITTSLSPTRAQGLQSLYQKMKERAILYTLQTKI